MNKLTSWASCTCEFWVQVKDIIYNVESDWGRQCPAPRTRERLEQAAVAGPDRVTVDTKPREAESWDGHELEPAGPWCHCKNNTKGNGARTLSGPSIANVLG